VQVDEMLIIVSSDRRPGMPRESWPEGDAKLAVVAELIDQGVALVTAGH
jgi:hypothetical protein